jgi:DNA-binding response OmpR family regulator
MENWYYVSPKTEDSVGPVSIGKLIAEATPETMVWKEDSLPDWIAAKMHPDLADFQEVLAKNSQELSETKSVPNSTAQEVYTSTYNVIINTEIVHKLAALKVLQDELACRLTEAAQLVETIPALVKSGLSLSEAETLSKRLAMNGIITQTVKVDNAAQEIPVVPILENEEFIIGKIKFDAQSRILYTIGEPTKLTIKENQLLKLLCKNQNEILDRNATLRAIWGDDNYFSGRSMDAVIASLRKLLREDERIEIMNMHGKGFILTVR